MKPRTAAEEANIISRTERKANMLMKENRDSGSPLFPMAMSQRIPC